MINNIRLLTAEVASQIAAGEVIERPASIIKELLENSIDAGSDEITINIRRSINGCIIITDNGRGIPKQDLPLAITQHATSKLTSLSDLQSIRSLGFRGEALASICSVAKVKITSKFNPKIDTSKQDNNIDYAWSIEVNGDPNDYSICQASHPYGTTIEVRDLFFNIPVRKRFLRAEKTEFQHIIDVFQKISLSNFSCGFTFISDDKVIYKLPRANTSAARSNRVKKILGFAFSNNAVYFEGEATDISIKGWLSNHNMHRSQTDQQFFFINNRMIRDKLILHAIRVAYADLIPEGRHPCYVLYLHIDPKHVDVNVHPTKHEVRFSESRWVHQFIVQQLSNVLHYNDDEGLTARVDDKNTNDDSTVPMRKISGYGNLVQKYNNFASKEDKLNKISNNLSNQDVANKPEINHEASGISISNYPVNIANVVDSSGAADLDILNTSNVFSSDENNLILSKQYFSNKLGKIIVDIGNNYLITNFNQEYFLVDLKSCYSYIIFNKLCKQWEDSKTITPKTLLLAVSISLDLLYCEINKNPTNIYISKEQFSSKLSDVLNEIKVIGFNFECKYDESIDSQFEFSDEQSGELINTIVINKIPEACRYAQPVVLFSHILYLLIKHHNSGCHIADDIITLIFNTLSKQALGRLETNLQSNEQQAILDELAKIDYNSAFFNKSMMAKKLTKSGVSRFMCSDFI